LVLLVASDGCSYIHDMRFIPTYCDACSGLSLTATQLIMAGALTCEACGEPARAVPGSSYGSEDVALYNELSTAKRG
jgi:hypothetical protein